MGVEQGHERIRETIVGRTEHNPHVFEESMLVSFSMGKSVCPDRISMGKEHCPFSVVLLAEGGVIITSG